MNKLNEIISKALSRKDRGVRSGSARDTILDELDESSRDLRQRYKDLM